MDIVPIRGYPGYAVGSNGRIYSHKSKKFLKGSPNPNGYLTVRLKDSRGVYKTCVVHKFVAAAFCPNPDNLVEVNHKNGVKTDNAPNNLEWTTRSANLLHAYRTGLKSNRGELGPTAKLTEMDVLDIKESLRDGVKGTVLAKKYGVGKHVIYNIKHNKTWAYI